MSTVAYRLTARTQRLALSRDASALVALSVLVGLVLVFTWNRWGNVDNDTGYDTLAGWRVAHGQLPYVDYVYYYGPLAPFALSLFFLAGGDGMAPALAFGLLMAVAILAATYALARTRVGVLGAFLATALVVPVAFSTNQFSFVDPHTHSATLAVLLALLVLLALHRFAQHGSRGSLAAAGVFAGLTLLTRPEFAIAVLLGGGAWLVARKRSGVASARESLVFFIPALAIPGAVYGAFLAGTSAHRLLFENLYPRDFYRAAGSTMLHARAPLTLSSFVSLGGKLVLFSVAYGAALAAVRYAERRPQLRRPALLVAFAVAALVVLASVANPDALRTGLTYAYGWIPAGAAIAAVLLLVRTWKTRDSDSGSNLELAATLVLAVVAASTYAGFYIEAFNAQMAVYALPLAAPFLAVLFLRCLGTTRGTALLGVAWLIFLAAAGAALTLKDARAETAMIHGPGGTIAAKPDQAAVYNKALVWIERTTEPGDQVLLAPQLTWLYAVSERRNPLRELSLLPGALAQPGAERAAIRRLAAEHVRLILTERRTFVGYGHTSFGGSFDRDLATWIHTHYRHAAVLGGSAPNEAQAPVDIWLRRDS